MISEKIRKDAFWLFDFIKGKPIAKHYKDIKEIFENKNNEQERINYYLDGLIKHATTTVDFYKKYDSKMDLSLFPSINKMQIKDQPQLFISSKYVEEKLHYMSTSGSTGTPFTCLQDLNKRNRVLAELIYFGQLCGFEIGMRNIFYRLWTNDQKKSWFAAFKQNMVKMQIIKLDEAQLEKMRQILKRDKKIKCIMGYASTLKSLARYMLDKGDNPSMFQIKTIISMAEKLPESTRKDLKSVFGSHVVSRYSNMENGILAQECTLGVEFHMNTASYFFELLKMDSDKPAEIGEMGRIVITDLFNYAMPFIRYDTGDIGILMKQSKCSFKTPVLKSVDGRQVDIIYDTKDQPISPLFEFGLEQFRKLKQYQVIQEDQKKYILNVNIEQDVYSDEELTLGMRQFLGEEAEIKVNYIADIPLLSSGKFKQNISYYKPKKK